MQWKDLGSDHNSWLLLKPPPNLELFVNQSNNATVEKNNGPKNISSCKYDIGEMNNIKIPHKNKILYMFQINTCSLNKNFDDLQHLLKAHWHVSKKRCSEKYCSCDEACQF